MNTARQTGGIALCIIAQKRLGWRAGQVRAPSPESDGKLKAEPENEAAHQDESDGQRFRCGERRDGGLARIVGVIDDPHALTLLETGSAGPANRSGAGANLFAGAGGKEQRRTIDRIWL